MKVATEKLKDQVTNMVTAHLDTIVKAKTHTSDTLRKLKQYAETQN